MAKRYSHDPDTREVDQSIRGIIDLAVERVKSDYGRHDQLAEIRLLTTVYLKRALDLVSDGVAHRFFLEKGRLRWEATGEVEELPSDSEVEEYWRGSKEELGTWDATVDYVTATSSGEDEQDD
jgi:hypothetical protein